MKLFKPLFIKYSIIFFLFVLGLISLGQLLDPGKIDLRFSLPLAALLGLFGGGIAAVFIGGYKKLEAMPPVDSSEYIEIDKAKLQPKLKIIRRYKLFFFGSFLLWPVYGVTITGIGLPEFMIYAYMVGFFFFGERLNSAKCPRCGHKFFSREIPTQFLTGRYYNAMTSKCMNCDLSLKSD